MLSNRLFMVCGASHCEEEFGSVQSPPGMVLNELWGIDDEDEINRRTELGEGLRSSDVAEEVLFMWRRPFNVTVRDWVMLPRAPGLLAGGCSSLEIGHSAALRELLVRVHEHASAPEAGVDACGWPGYE